MAEKGLLTFYIFEINSWSAAPATGFLEESTKVKPGASAGSRRLKSGRLPQNLED